LDVALMTAQVIENAAELACSGKPIEVHFRRCAALLFLAMSARF
jgi:hypothetical protein